MNNKKGNVGVYIMLFVGIIVAIALFVPIADTTGNGKNLQTQTLANYTTSATANGTVTLAGREATTAITVVNASNPSDVWTSNFTLVETDSNGRQAVLLKTTDAAVTAGQNGSLASVTYTYKPWGYDNTSGGRTMLDLILIGAALAIAAFALIGVKKDWF